MEIKPEPLFKKAETLNCRWRSSPNCTSEAFNQEESLKDSEIPEYQVKTRTMPKGKKLPVTTSPKPSLNQSVSTNPQVLVKTKSSKAHMTEAQHL